MWHFHCLRRHRKNSWANTDNIRIVQRVSSQFLSVQASPSSKTSTESDIKAARQWLARFTVADLPRSIGDLSYSRSGGPGGQNVNKVNSKATLKVPLDTLKGIVPRALQSALSSSRFYAVRSDSLIIQSDENRAQAENVDSCFRKLFREVRDLGSLTIPGETSDSQKDRVQKLQKADNETRIRMKKHQSSKKCSRRGGRDD